MHTDVRPAYLLIFLILDPDVKKVEVRLILEYDKVDLEY